MIETITENDSASKIIRRMKQLKDVRKDYENGLWYDIARFVNPRRENIKADDWSKLKGQRRGKDSYDGTPLGALNTWADGMQGFLVDESLAWFRSEMAFPELNEDDEIREWLQMYDRAMYMEFSRSNFYSILGEWFRDAGSIGTATLYAEENVAEKSVNFTAIHPREPYISENSLGVVDTVYREFEMTMRQMVQEFGEDKFDEVFLKESRDNPEKKKLIIHAVEPNKNYFSNSRNPKYKKYKSVYVWPDGQTNKRILREGGYGLCPYAVWRYRKNSDEVYGYSPAADAIVEVFNLNQFGKTKLQAVQMAVEPPYNVPAEMRGNVRILPKGYNYYDDPQRVITPVVTGINYPASIEELQRLQKSIEDKYRVQFFLALTQAAGERELKATHVLEMRSEQAVMMGPQTNRLISEGLKKVFDIVSDIADRAGRLPPPPMSLLESGSDIKINFIGPLAQAQKRMFYMQPIRNGLNELGLAAAMNPSVLDRVNWDEMSETILEASDFPQKLILNDDQLADLRAQKAQAEQAQQAAMMAQGMADAYPKTVKKPEAGSPAEKIMAGMGA